MPIPIPTDEIRKSVFHVIKDTLTGSPILDAIVLFVLSLFAGWVNSNKEYIANNPKLGAIVWGVIITIVIIALVIAFS
jgi:hypothetical protein